MLLVALWVMIALTLLELLLLAHCEAACDGGRKDGYNSANAAASQKERQDLAPPLAGSAALVQQFGCTRPSTSYGHGGPPH